MKNKIEEAKLTAENYLRKELRTFGHFPIFENYPEFSEKKHLGWHYRYPSPYLHANVMYSLLNCGFSEKDDLLVLGKQFLLNTKEVGNIWRFWKTEDADHAVFCGTDDTAIASLVLSKLDVNCNNRKILESCIKNDGTIRTWIISRPNMLLINLRSYLWLRRVDRPVNHTIKLGFLKKDDVDTNITLNTLTYLGETERTESTVKYIIDVWLNRTTSHFLYYINKPIFVYHIARAFKEGVLSFRVLKEPILKYIKDEYNNFHFVELMMAFLAIKYMSINDSVCNEIKKKVIDQINEKKLFLEPFPIITGVHRRYFGGGGCLTAAWFIEFYNYMNNSVNQ